MGNQPDIAAGRSEIENLPLASGGRRISDEELDVIEASVSLRHRLKVWESRRDRRQGRAPSQELYWENVVELGHEEISSALDLPHDTLRRLAVTSALTWRSVWGLFRLGIAYVDVGGGR